MLTADCASIALAQILSYLLRFELVVPLKEVHNLLLGILFLVPFKIFVFYWFGLYRGMWRYTGIRDLQNLLRANISASLIIIVALLLFNRFEGLSRSIFLIDSVLCFLFTAGLRVVIRIYYANRNSGVKVTFKRALGLKSQPSEGLNTLLVGAGSSGEALIREIENNPNLNINSVGFLDDDPRKKGMSLHGVPVLGNTKHLKDVVAKCRVKQIFLTMPSASATQIRRVVKLCEETGLPYKTLPGYEKLIDGSISVQDLRDVNYEDLLGRSPVELDEASISDYIKDNSILITGAGGSIGSELCRQIVKFHPKHLLILDHSEFNLFRIDSELKKHSNGMSVTCVLGQIQDKVLMEKVLIDHAPKIVFHAAAYKHVPLVEESPWAGVINNIVGSKILMDAAVAHGVERFVVVSSDKAVRPTNVMGACKRVSEMIALSLNGGGTKFMAVRFGNVVGSSGSVVPHFRQQIRDGGPITVTHPEATRYFMTIPEASRLILQAGALGSGGEIFVLEMGTPVNILEMAKDLIRLSGKEPYEDIDIVITGLREGEKINEELIADDDHVLNTEHKKIMILIPDINENCCGDQAGYRESLNGFIAKLHEAALHYDREEIKALLREVVREYTPCKFN
ncbi:MAG: polysaccharide biosynthesis protein [Desulfarculaceae bacterium]|nr:polysaccharide biosynthesis protein [Desulfarculaceae bacterium]